MNSKAKVLTRDSSLLEHLCCDLQSLDKSTVDLELAIYKEIIVSPADTDTSSPVCFWKTHQASMPILAGIAVVALAIPLNSADGERSFSKYNSLLSPQRLQLSELSVRQHLALYFN